MSRRSLFILGAVLAVLSALFGVWVYQNFERTLVEARGGLSPEARRNPYLAAERFLERLGVETTSEGSRERLQTPPESAGLMIVRHLGWDLTETQIDALEAWMERGGHLVVTPPKGDWGEDDDDARSDLLARFGLAMVAVEEETSDPYRLEGLAAGAVEVRFRSGWTVLDRRQAADWQAAPAGDGHHLVQLRLGDGRLTVLTDQNWLENDAIGELDHAFLLADLVGEADQAWLLYRTDAPPLTRLLWQWAPHLVLSVLLLIPIWLGAQTQRSGPLIHQGEAPRRNLLEHLEAGARFIWKPDRGAGLLRSAQRRIEQQWLRRQPVLERKNPTQRSEWIGRLLEIQPGAVHRALYEPARNEQEFIRLSATLWRLSRGLRDGGRAQQSTKRP